MRVLYFQALALAAVISCITNSIEGIPSHFPEEASHLSSKPLYDVSVLGAPATGALVEGVVGSIQKGCRHRFFCHSSSPAQGFLGPQTIAEPLSIKDQPGVFPAPLMGPAALTFCFNCDLASAPFTPIIVRPDGTIFYGQPMTSENSPQTLVIASPAQTGIYTIFILAHQKEKPTQAVVDASVSTQPQERKTFHLQSLASGETNP